MKKIILTTGLLGLLVASCNKKEALEESTNAQESIAIDNTENSLDFLGAYEGVIPCADCDGIKTEISLSDGNKFSLVEEYLGKSGADTKEGVFTFDNDSNVLLLTVGDQTYKYKVKGDTLVFLDTEGQEIDGDLKENYILHKK